MIVDFFFLIASTVSKHVRRGGLEFTTPRFDQTSFTNTFQVLLHIAKEQLYVLKCQVASSVVKSGG
jgi:hypothetical protein